MTKKFCISINKYSLLYSKYHVHYNFNQLLLLNHYRNINTLMQAFRSLVNIKYGDFFHFNNAAIYFTWTWTNVTTVKCMV